MPSQRSKDPEKTNSPPQPPAPVQTGSESTIPVNDPEDPEQSPGSSAISPSPPGLAKQETTTATTARNATENAGHAIPIANQKGNSSGKDLYPEQDLDNGIVGWEGLGDPENPRFDALT